MITAELISAAVGASETLTIENDWLSITIERDQESNGWFVLDSGLRLGPMPLSNAVYEAFDRIRPAK